MKIKINISGIKRMIKILCICTLINVLYVKFFYWFANASKYTIRYSYAQAILAAVLFSLLFYKNSPNVCPRMSFLAVYIVIIYYSISSVKYILYVTSPNLIADNHIRFRGSLILFFSILLSVLFIQMYKKNAYVAIYDSTKNVASFSWIISIGLLLYYIVYFYLFPHNIYVDSSMINSSARNALINFIINFCAYLGIFFTACYFSGSWWTKIPTIVLMLAEVYCSFRSGSRSVFILTILMYLFLLTYQKKISIQIILIIGEFVPFLILLFSYITFWISGRNTQLLSFTANIEYRFDMADLGITILEKTSYFRFNINEIIDGCKMCIPSFMISEGFKGKNSYKSILQEASLITTHDYGDSFFSMGVNAFGILGFLFLFPLLLSFFNKIDNRLRQKDIKGLLYLSMVLPLLIHIEIDWTYFIARIRDCLLMVFLSYFIYYYILQNRKKD